MKRKLILTMIITLSIITVILTGCTGETEDTVDKSVATIGRGELVTGVTADGNLVMPHEVKLRFGSPGTVKEILVDEGNMVKAGTLLAKLDDASQRIAIESAQYDLQLALSELAETVPGCCQVLGYPRRYPNNSATLSFQQAQEEMEQAWELLLQGNHKEAVSKLRIAVYDMEASQKLLNTPIVDAKNYPDIANDVLYVEKDPELLEYLDSYPAIGKAVYLIQQDLETLAHIQKLIEQASYSEAIAALDKAIQESETSNRAISSVQGQIIRFGVAYPDTATSLDFLKTAQDSLAKLQEIMAQDDYDPVKFAEILRMAQHDLQFSHDILKSQEMVMEHGLNLKAMQQYNLNVHKAELALQNYKEELLKTEILAPFDGTVVAIGVKVNDQLSAYDYSSITAIHLVDTITIELDGLVDEIDIFKVKMGQKATITVDALPQEELSGTVIFISPFGTEATGVVNYAVKIELDPTDADLRGGLTATADIITKKRENVLLIPNGAIKGSRGDYWTEVVIDEETMETERRDITIGVQNALYAEILSGIDEGEKVIVEQVRSASRSLF
ncbi:efflux RND transporter periplasmic adaptor subunit [Chloroflexota bacterium]